MKNSNFTYVKMLLCFLFAGGIVFLPISAMAGAWSPESQTVSGLIGIFQGTCFLCDMIKGMLQAMATYANSAATILVEPAQIILGLGLAFWILSHTMKNIAIMGFMESGVAEYLRSLFNRLFLTVIVAGFLNAWGGATGIEELFNAVLAPIFYLGVAFANEFLVASLPAGGGSGSTVISYFGNDPLCTFAMGQITTDGGVVVSLDTGSGIISDGIIEATVCIIMQIGAFLKTGLLASWILLNFAFAEAPFGLFFVPVAAVLGLFIFGYPYISMMVYVPMYLIEAITKIIVVGALLPLFAVACVFPSTRNFSLKAINIVVTASLTFMFMGMFVGISTEFLITIYEKLTGLFSLDNGKDIIDFIMGFSAQEIVVIVVMPFMLMSMLGKAEKFAQYFGGVPFKGLNFVSGASKVAQGAVATTIKQSMTTYRKAGHYASRAGGMMNSLFGTSQKRAALNSYNPEGGPQLMAKGPNGRSTHVPLFNNDGAASDNAPDNLASGIDAKFHDILGIGGGNQAQSSSDVADAAFEGYKKSQETDGKETT